jgi:hypothetical protein
MVLDPEYIGRAVFLTSLIIDELGTKRHYHVEDGFHHLNPND